MDSASPSPRAQLVDRVAFGLCLVMLAVWSLNVLALAIDEGYLFDGDFADGTFQLLNPLRRLASGQVAGRDFQFFHGIGVPLVHYPLFVLLGKTLAAAEITRRALSPLAALVSLLVGWRWVTGTWKLALYLATVSLVVMDMTPMREILYAYNSLVAIRTLAPVLALAAFTLPIPPLRVGALAGFWTGVAALLGTEHFIALAVAGVMVGALECLPGGRREVRQTLFVAAATAGLVAAVLLLLATHGDTAAAAAVLNFNFRELPTDQFWYFGADPAHYLAEWKQFLDPPYLLFALVLAGVALAASLSVRRRLRDAPDRQVRVVDAGLMLALYGLLSLGSLTSQFIIKNATTCYRSLLLFVLGALFFGADSRAFLRPALGRLFLVLLVLRELLGLTGYYTTPGELSMLAVYPPEAWVALQKNRPVLSEMWQNSLDAYFKAAQSSGVPHPTLWSTFTGLPESVTRSFGADTDYIVHALGPVRRARYLQTFDRVSPDLVQTEMIAPRYPFEEWNQYTAWPFYERVLRNYVPAATSPHSIFWRRLTAADPPPAFSAPQPLAISAGRDIRLTIPPQTTSRLAIVHLKYASVVHHRWLPLAGSITRFGVRIDGARNLGRVPLNPLASEVTFPVRLVPGDSPTMHAFTDGLWQVGEITIEAADVSFVDLSPAYDPFIMGGPGVPKKRHAAP